MKRRVKDEDMKKRHINVRFDEDAYEMVQLIADRNRTTKSDVVRQALDGELANISEHKNTSLSDEDREHMMKKLGAFITVMSKMQSANNKLGNNINQLVRAQHQGQKGVSTIDISAYENYQNKIGDNLDVMSKELNKLWLTLV